MSMRQSNISNNFGKYTYQKECKCHEINIKTMYLTKYFTKTQMSYRMSKEMSPYQLPKELQKPETNSSLHVQLCIGIWMC